MYKPASESELIKQKSRIFWSYVLDFGEYRQKVLQIYKNLSPAEISEAINELDERSLKFECCVDGALKDYAIEKLAREEMEIAE